MPFQKSQPPRPTRQGRSVRALWCWRLELLLGRSGTLSAGSGYEREGPKGQASEGVVFQAAGFTDRLLTAIVGYRAYLPLSFVQ